MFLWYLFVLYTTYKGKNTPDEKICWTFSFSLLHKQTQPKHSKLLCGFLLFQNTVWSSFTFRGPVGTRPQITAIKASLSPEELQTDRLTDWLTCAGKSKHTFLSQPLPSNTANQLDFNRYGLMVLKNVFEKQQELHFKTWKVFSGELWRRQSQKRLVSPDMKGSWDQAPWKWKALCLVDSGLTGSRCLNLNRSKDFA